MNAEIMHSVTHDMKMGRTSIKFCILAKCSIFHFNYYIDAKNLSFYISAENTRTMAVLKILVKVIVLFHNFNILV